jgi:tetratricopeptide (TPR) repeat protein
MRVHPRDSVLQQALGPTGEGFERIRRHLSQCERCRERLSGLALSGLARRRATKLDTYGPVLERCLQSLEIRAAALKRERLEASGLMTRFLSLPRARQQLLLLNSPRFRSWGLFELLIQTGWEETFRDPRRTEEILELALEASQHLDSFFYGSDLLEDMRARIWGYIANAHRARRDLPAAEAAFSEAFQHLERGTEDPMERAVLFDLEASLRRAERRFEEAVQLSKRAIRIFRKAGEDHRVGRTLVNLSIAHSHMGDPAGAISLLQQASPLIDRNRDPRLALYTMNNLADNLAMTGRFMEAQRVLSQARPLYRRFSEPLVQGPRLWVESKIAVGLGRLAQAIELLSAARSCFVATNSDLDVNMVSRQLESLRAAREKRSF